MDKTFQHFNQYTTDSVLDWPGLNSSKFPKPRLMHPRRDLIKSGKHQNIQDLTSLIKFNTQEENIMSPDRAQNIPSNLDWDNIEICNIGIPDKAAKKYLNYSSLSLTPAIRKVISNNLSSNTPKKWQESEHFTAIVFAKVNANILSKTECKENWK